MKRSIGLGSLVCMAATAVPAIFGNGVIPAKVDLLNGVAWLPNEATGEVVRVNGETARVDANVDLEGSGQIEVGQNGSTVVVRIGDQMRSLDVSQLNWGASWTPSAGGLVVGDRAAYTVTEDGIVTALDPATLASLGSVSLGAAPAGPSTVLKGRLVVPLSDGTVKVVAGKRVLASVDAGRAGDRLAVSAVGDQIVVLNATAKTLRRLDPRDGRASDVVRAELPDGDLVVPTRLPSGRLWLTAGHTGDLVGVSIYTGRAKAVNVAAPRSDLVGPAVSGEHVYVVDRTAATVVVVDARSLAVAPATPLEVNDPSRVQLVAEGGKVFVNDPTSPRAIVFDGEEARGVDKYSDEGLDEPEPQEPSDDPGPTTGPPQTPTGGEQPAPPPPEPVPPAPPGSVAATAGNESATVSWTAGGGAAAYHVTYDGLNRPIEVGGDQLSVEVGNLDNGEEYVFEVWASNEAGDSERVASNPVVPNDRVPGTPTQVRAESRDASAHLTWEAADDRGREIKDYVVTANPGGLTQRVGGAATQTEFTGLTNGTKYRFTVTAVNDLDVQGQPSDETPEVMPYGVPGPFAVDVQPSNGTLALDWTDAQNFSQTKVTYTLTVSPADARVAPTQDTQARITGLTNGTQYTVTITPSNDRGNGPAQRVPGRPGSAPTISGVNVERTGARQFRVSWDGNDGGRQITRCTVSGGASGSCLGGSATLDVPTYDIDYTFTVTVGNEFGDAIGNGGGHSGPKTLTVDADAGRWDGARCSWPGHEGTRPVLGGRETCTNFLAWVPNRDTVSVYCWDSGKQHQDDYFNQSTTYVYVGYGGTNGWMSHLYFTSYQDLNGTIEGLRHC